jgi:hypothetical protein
MNKPFKSVLAASASLGAVAGLVLLPATADAANTTTVNAVVSKTASVATTSGTVNLNITPTTAGSFTSASDTVTAGTNSATGYQLQISAATTALTNGGSTIPASSGTPVAPVSLANNTWGYRVDGQYGFGAGPTSAQNNQASLTGTWAGLTSSAVSIKNYTTGVVTGDSTTVWYGAAADFSKASGTYTTSVTYTGLAN